MTYLDQLQRAYDAQAAHLAAAQAEVARLRAALRPFAKMADSLRSEPDDWMLVSWDAGAVTVSAADIRAARAELEGSEG